MEPNKLEMKKFSIRYYNLYKSEKYLQAEKILFEKLKKYPDQVWLLHRMSQVNRKLGNNKKALAYSYQAYKITPWDEESIGLYSYMLYLNKLYKRSIRLLEKFLLKDKEDLSSAEKRKHETIIVDSYYQLALNYYELGEKEKAKDLILRHLSERHKVKSLWNKTGVMYTLKEIEGKVPQYPTKEESKKISEKIKAFQNAKKFRQMENYIVKTLEKFPMDYWLMIILAETYIVNLDKPQEAKEYSQRAYKINPNDPLIIFDHAMVLYENHLYKRSIKIIQKLINWGVEKIIANPHSEGKKWSEGIFMDSYYLLALNFIAIGEKQKAKEYIEHYLQIWKKGIPSVYTKKQVINNLNSIEGI